jgi:hypothetical protein
MIVKYHMRGYHPSLLEYIDWITTPDPDPDGYYSGYYPILINIYVNYVQYVTAEDEHIASMDGYLSNIDGYTYQILNRLPLTLGSTGGLRVDGYVTMAPDTSLDGYADSIDTKLTTTNALLTIADGYLNTIQSTTATSAKQDTGNTSLSHIDGYLNTIQSTVATSAKQDTGNTSLSHIDGYTNTIATNTTSIDGKLPTTAALADAVANPTLTKISTFLQGYNGSTWDRIVTGKIGVQTSFTGTLSTLPLGKYTATIPKLTDGYGYELQLNTQADLSVAEALAPQYEDNYNQVAWIHNRPLSSGTAGQVMLWSDTTTGNDGYVIAKATAGRVYLIQGYNANNNVRYVQLYHLASKPSDGVITMVAILPVAGNSTFSLDFGVWGRYCSAGIFVALSSTRSTFTATYTDLICNIGYM